jgi:hypothetical protein
VRKLGSSFVVCFLLSRWLGCLESGGILYWFGIWIYGIGMRNLGSCCVNIFVLLLAGTSWNCTALKDDKAYSADSIRRDPKKVKRMSAF